MDLKLHGKTALVTGGSEGIGKGIALALAKEGVDLAMCARRKEPLEAAAKEIAQATGRKIVAIAADLRQDTDAKAFIEQGHKALGRVDIMVNNAGSAAMATILRPVARAISFAAASSGSLRRAHMATSTPSFASASAMPLPMPSLPPVTSAVLP